MPWLAYARWPASFSFWALTVGALVPDLEVLPLLLVTDVHHGRALMHSVPGVLTVNAIVSVLAVRIVIPRLMRWYDRKWPDHPEGLRFAGRDLRNDPTDLGTLYASAALGGITHVLVDIPTHSYNPLWWPWQVGPLNVVPFSDALWYDVITTVAWLAFFAVVVRAFWRR